MANLSSFFRYYGEVFRRAFESVWHFGKQQVIISILSATFILILQIHFGMIPKDLNFAAWVSVVTPYLGIIIVSFLIEFVRSPYILDRMKQIDYDEKKRRELAAAQLETGVMEEKLRTTQLELEKLRSEIAENEKHKLIFEIDIRKTIIRVEQTKSALRIYADIQLRFENRDIHPLSVKNIDITLHRMGIENVKSSADIFTLFAILRVTSNGVQLNNDVFEGMTIAGHQLSSYYLIETMIAIEDEENIKTAEDLDVTDYLRITMQSSGTQPELTAKLHPYWEAARRVGGTRQIHVIGAPSIREDFRRLH